MWLHKASAVEATIQAQHPRQLQIKREHLQLRRGGNYTQLSGECAPFWMMPCPAIDLHRGNLALILWQLS